MMKMTQEQKLKYLSASSADELVELAAQEGETLSQDQAGKYFEAIKKSGEISDEELGAVAGGGCGDVKYPFQIGDHMMNGTHCGYDKNGRMMAGGCPSAYWLVEDARPNGDDTFHVYLRCPVCGQTVDFCSDQLKKV